MRLSTKLVLIGIGLIPLLSAVDWTVHHFYLRGVLERMEVASARRDIARISAAIDREVAAVDRLCHDWASWDDTYAFVRTRSEAYIAANLIAPTFSMNQLHLISICGPDGRPVWSGMIDPETGMGLPLPGFIRAGLSEAHPLRVDRPGAPAGGISGFLTAAVGPMIVSARPILTSQDTGPPRGTFIMGRIFDDATVGRLADQTRVGFSLLSVEGDGLLPADPAAASADRSTVIRVDGGDLVARFPVADVAGHVAFVVRAVFDREIYHAGQAALRWTAVWEAAGALICIILALVLIRTFLLGSVRRLGSAARRLSGSTDSAARLGLEIPDEIGDAGRDIDTHLTALARDRAAAEAEIRDYREILNGLDHEIIVVDRAGRITDVNREILVSVDRTRFEMVNRACHQVFRSLGPLYRGLRGQVERVFETGRADRCRYCSSPSDRDGCYYDVRVAPMADADGVVRGAVVAVEDATSEVRMEAQLRQSQKMEAIGTLAGGIAHDFNNILMSLMMNLEFAIRKLDGRPESVRESLDLSLKAACRARDLVEQILTFSRRKEQEKLPMSLTPAIKESMKMLRASLPTTIEINTRMDAEADVVLADPTQIQQILINLSSNAAYAMRDGGGTLTLALDPATLPADAPGRPDLPPGPYLRLTVADTGGGIPSDIRPRIFEPFFTTKPSGEGTGMGLSVVQSIVEGMGGAIEVDSAAEVGTTFTIFLPRHQGEQTASIDPVPPPLHGNGRILVIDDEQTVVRIITKILTDGGYDVEGATNSLDAMERFRADPGGVDLVITDQTMPGLTGTALSREMLRVRPDLPIILCTGFSELISRDKAKALGISEFIMKPISATELLRVIHRLLHEH